MSKLHEALKKYFGYDTFREYQEKIISQIMNGTDVVGIMPTGAGKSLCYQLPAILSDGVTLVISPLISLMKDQVDYLNSIGVDSAYLNSSLSGSDYHYILNGIYHNKFKLIYVAPERLENESFLEAMNGTKVVISNLVIDEAHCVSRWGHDFRPSYTKIENFIQRLNKRPVVAAFTATATENVKRDIISSLSLKNPEVFITSFDRKNLEFKVFVNENKEQYIKSYIKNHPKDSGIIYTATRKDAEKLYKTLTAGNMDVSIYHAGLSDQERMKAQEDFIYDVRPVMIATNAFGMGIDKSNVRYVIHYNMPRDLESYYQEAGRAGRDGLNSVCILLYSAGDTAIQKFFIDESDIAEERKSHEYKKLQLMESYCHTSTCLRKYILEYFGDFSLQEPCGNCSVCNTEVEEKDITLQAQMILSCINRSGQRFGRSIIVDTLRGSKNQKIQKFKLNELKTYGLMKDYPKENLDLLMNKLIAEGYIYKTEEQYPVLKLTNLSIPLLKNEAKLSLQVAKKEENIIIDNNDLLSKLKEVRFKLAKQEGFPPYVIFHDATLIEMARKMPSSFDELATIKGVGENKLNKYGEVFLKVIQNYNHANQSDSEYNYSQANNTDKEYNYRQANNADKEYNYRQANNAGKEYNYSESNNTDNEYNYNQTYNTDNEYNYNQTYNTDNEYNYSQTHNIGNEYNNNLEHNVENERGNYLELNIDYNNKFNKGYSEKNAHSKMQYDVSESIQSNKQDMVIDNNHHIEMIQFKALDHEGDNIDIHQSSIYNNERNIIDIKGIKDIKDIKEKAYHKYFKLYQSGKSVEEIKEIIGVQITTVEKNLIEAYEFGEDICIDDFIQEEYELEIISLIVKEDWDGKLKYVKERVSEKVTYRSIRAVISKLKMKLKLFQN